jgi:hypothetical protein
MEWLHVSRFSRGDQKPEAPSSLAAAEKIEPSSSASSWPGVSASRALCRLRAVSHHGHACILGAICAAIDFAILLGTVTYNPAAAMGA